MIFHKVDNPGAQACRNLQFTLITYSVELETDTFLHAAVGECLLSLWRT